MAYTGTIPPQNKPPLGLKPRYIHEIERIEQIQDAIKRYYDNFLKIPDEWFEELKELLNRHSGGK